MTQIKCTYHNKINLSIKSATIEVKRAEEIQVSIQTQARALMRRHHQMIEKRERSMLSRVVAEMGLDVDVTQYHNHIQGQTIHNFWTTYDRSHAAMS